MSKESAATYVNRGRVMNYGNMVGFLLQIAQSVISVLCVLEVMGNHLFTLEQVKYVQGAVFGVALVIWPISIVFSSKFSGLDERTSFWCEWAIFTMYTGITTFMWWNMDQRFDGARWDHRHSTSFGDVNVYWQSHYYNILIGTILYWPWLLVLHFLSIQTNVKNNLRAASLLERVKSP